MQYFKSIVKYRYRVKHHCSCKGMEWGHTGKYESVLKQTPKLQGKNSAFKCMGEEDFAKRLGVYPSIEIMKPCNKKFCNSTFLA